MRTIIKLPDDVINQIAAGEVIERPASIVKELIENSLDADASEITIELEDYGKKLISVSDNGSGIFEEDLGLAPARHATSKISTAQDLWKLSTLGFRGEALSTIFAVSSCTIASRVASSDVGFEFNSNGEKRPVAMSVGTKVEVRDLFANIPARRKFLKSNQTELAHIREILDRIALGNPTVRFKFLHDGRVLEDYLRVTHLFDRVTAVMKSEMKDIDLSELIPIEADAGEMALQGVLWPSKITRGSNQKIFLFVNHRPIRDRLLMHAVLSGYQTLLPQGAFPVAVLYLNIDSKLVDVNVHPAKSEVRFVHTGSVHDFVSKNVRKALATYRGIASVSPRNDETVIPAKAGIHSQFLDSRFRGNDSYVRNDEVARTDSLRHCEEGASPTKQSLSYNFVSSKPLLLREESDLSLQGGLGGRQSNFLRHCERSEAISRIPSGAFSSLRLIGQAAASYIICEREDALVIIDQHAAHERVKFETLRSQFENGEVHSQLLLVAEIVELSEREVAEALENKDAFKKLGWEIDSFGANSLAIKSVPAILGSSNLRSLVSSLLSEILTITSQSKLESTIQKVLATVACHSAIRFNQSLTIEEMKNLLRDLDKVELISNCPHGRPIVTEIPFKKLSTLFHRA